ncbi:MAG: disulfide bond formation protein B [Pseudomonadales bacterium]|nr:disulfide bond formation protein B [Pseudomonadales bacterium]
MNSTDWALATLSVIAFLLAGAQYMEHILYLDPCPLCMMQRIWFVQIGLVACLAIAHNSRLRIYPLLMFFGAVIGAGFSIRQLYLQNLPIDQVPTCGADLASMIDYFPLSDILRAMTMGTGSCSEISWSFLGISIAGYALLAFIFLAILALGQWKSVTIPHQAAI